MDPAVPPQAKPQTGTPEVGLWCQTCQDFSRLRFPVVAIMDWGVLDLGTLTYCAECESASDAVAAWRQLHRI